ncbi:MAG TPA: hypothetical protein VGD06_04210, partial [Acidobacteriota bacterium]
MTGATAVFFYAFLTAVATALGALPFLFVRRLSARTIAYANAIASGLMLGACYSLVAEGAALGSLQTGAGAVLGVGFILLTQRYLHDHEIEFGNIRGVDAKRMSLIVIVMTVHSAAEGVAIGASFAGDITLAALITGAIAVHNVPERLAISAVPPPPRRHRPVLRLVELLLLDPPAPRRRPRLPLRRRLPPGAPLRHGLRRRRHGLHGPRRA